MTPPNVGMIVQMCPRLEQQKNVCSPDMCNMNCNTQVWSALSFITITLPSILLYFFGENLPL